MNVKEFIEQSKVKTLHKGKLTPWKAEISELREAGMTYKQIQEFLSINEVNVSLKSIAVFCKKHFADIKEPKPRKAGFMKRGVEATSTSQQTNPQPTTEPKKSNYVPPSWAGDVNIDDII